MATMCEDACAMQQLAELEMLESMFSKSGELVLDDPSALIDLRSSVEGKIPANEEHSLRLKVRFTLNLVTDKGNTVEIKFILPCTYPRTAPEASVSSSVWSRRQHSRFTEALRAAVSDLHVPDEPCVHEVVRWVLDHVDAYLTESPDHGDSIKFVQSSQKGPVLFTRLWIYSHHIYNTAKRKAIIETSRELDLSGFSVVGKPGIICVEGDRDGVEEFWTRIRAMQWQRICVRHREDLTEDETQRSSIDELRRFDRFEEKTFEPRPGKGRGSHADLGLLYQFLNGKGFGDVFRLYFGVDGKEAPH